MANKRLSQQDQRLTQLKPSETKRLSNVLISNLKPGTDDTSEMLALKRKIRDDPQNSSNYNDLGVCLLFKGRFEEAETILKRGIRLNRQDSDLWNNLGSVLYEQDKKEEAEKASRRAIKLSPEIPFFKTSLANILSSRKDYDGAIKILSEFFGGEFDDPGVRINLALNFKAKGLIGLAIDQLEQAMELTVGAKEEDLINLQKHATKLMKEYKKLREKGKRK